MREEEKELGEDEGHYEEESEEIAQQLNALRNSTISKRIKETLVSGRAMNRVDSRQSISAKFFDQKARSSPQKKAEAVAGEDLMVEDYEEDEEQKSLEKVRLSAVGLLGVPEDGEKKSGFASGDVTPSTLALGIEPKSPDRKKPHTKSKFLNAPV